MEEMISRDAVITILHHNWGKPKGYSQSVNEISELPTVQPDEKLERCLFEYINACRTANCPTPDTTRKDISDAYAVIKVLQPIFGDVPFAKVERGEADE